MITEEKEDKEQEESGLRKQTKENNNKMENIRDSYDELQKNPQDKEP